MVGREAMMRERYFAALVAQGIGVACHSGLHQHGREHGHASDQGPHAALHFLWRHGVIVNCMAVAILLRVDFENRASTARSGVRR